MASLREGKRRIPRAQTVTERYKTVLQDGSID